MPFDFLIRSILPGEGDRLRELRMRALADAPDAFQQTLADVEDRPAEEWERLAALRSDGESETMFIASEQMGATRERWIGMVGAFLPDERSGYAELVALWVDQDFRHQGIATALVEAVFEWAREKGVDQVRLWVTESSEAARVFYEGLSFASTSEVAPLRAGSSLVKRRLIRRIDT